MLNNDIIYDLTCDVCNEIYAELKQLPCGHTLCEKCIVQFKNTENELVCETCKQSHSIPTDGFPSYGNKYLIKQERELSFEELEFKQLKSELEERMKQIQFEINNGDYVISEHCRELRRLVQLSKEDKIQQINNINENLMKRIEKFESESINSYLSINKTLFEANVNELTEKFQKLDSNKADMSRLISEIRLAQTQLRREQENLKYSTFNGELINFRVNKTNLDTDFLCIMSSYPFKTLRFSKLNQIDFSKHLIDRSFIEIKGTGFFLNGDFIVISMSRDQRSFAPLLQIFQFDESRELKKIKTFEDVCYRKGLFQIKCNQLCLFYRTSKFVLHVLDQNLETVKQIEVENEKLIGADEDNIYCLRDDTTEPLVIYDWQLEQVDQKGQNINPNEPFYFGQDCSQLIKVKTEARHYYLVRLHEMIRIIDQLSGRVLKSISATDELRFLFDCETLTLIVCDNDRFLYYDINGNYLKEVKILDKPKNYRGVWSLDRLNNFYFFNEVNFTLFI